MNVLGTPGAKVALQAVAVVLRRSVVVFASGGSFIFVRDLICYHANAEDLMTTSDGLLHL